MTLHSEYDHAHGCMYCGAAPDRPTPPQSKPPSLDAFIRKLRGIGADEDTIEHARRNWRPQSEPSEPGSLDVERLARAIASLRDQQMFPDDGYWSDAAYRQKDGSAEVARWLAAEYARLANTTPEAEREA